MSISKCDDTRAELSHQANERVSMIGPGQVSYDEQYCFVISDKLDINGAVSCLTDVMSILSDHPNIDPLAFQGALMSAMMQSGN